MGIELYKQSYDDKIRRLAGKQKNNLLFEFVSKQAKAGESCYVDGIVALDDADQTDIDNYTTYKRASESAGGISDFAEYLTTQTPHKKTTKQRSQIFAQVISWSTWLDTEDKVGQMLDPTDSEIEMGMGRMEAQKDSMILTALAADTVIRGKGAGALAAGGDLAAVAFPAGQFFTGSDATRLTLDDIADVVKIFKNNWISGMKERIYMIISPEQETLLRQNETSINDKDFVDSSRYYMDDYLPSIYGVHLIVHADVDDHAKALFDDIALAFTTPGVVWNTFKGRTNHLQEVGSANFEWVAMLKELGGVVRHDDKRCVHVNIGTGV